MIIPYLSGNEQIIIIFLRGMYMKLNWKQIFWDYFFITLGTLVLAVGLNIFLAPNKISGGGVSSIGTVLLHLFKVPLSVTNIVFNVILFAAGYKFLGKGAVIKTAAGIVLLSLFLQITSYFPAYTGDLMIATLLGGVLMGAGVGLVVRQNGSTGGSDLAALIFHRFLPHISVATFILIIDCTIILGAALVFKSFTVAAYSVLSLYLSSIVTDRIMTFGDEAKSVYIISKEHEQIAEEVMVKFERGVTAFHTVGCYTKEEGETLLCVVSPKELPLLIRTIRRLDPAAFIVINDSREVLGEGFKDSNIYDM